MALGASRRFRSSSARIGSAAVALVALVLYSELVLRTLSYAGQDSRVCIYNVTSPPMDGVNCTTLDSEPSSCKIFELIEYHCYLHPKHSKCRNYVGHNISSSGNELTLWNLNVTTFPIVIITNHNDTKRHWLLETHNASSVIVKGLPENSTVEDAYAFNNQTCPGCPQPEFHWFPLPSKHRIRFKVDLGNESILSVGENVTILLYSSNDSHLTESDICLHGMKPKPRIVSGHVSTQLTIDDIYNTEFCIRFELTGSADKNSTPYYYACGRHLDMREHHITHIRGEIKTPVWWSVILATLSAVLSMMIFTLFAARKGWLRTPISFFAGSRRAMDTNSDPNANAPTVVTADITNDTTTIAMNPTSATVTRTPITRAFRACSASGEKRLCDAAVEQSQPFLNGVAPEIEDTVSASMTNTQKTLTR